MKFCTLHQILNPLTVTWPKIEIFKIQDGGGRHLENRIFLAINHWQIVRFQQNFVWGSRTTGRQGLHDKTAHFKIPTWRTAAILKIVKLPYLSEKSSHFNEIWCTASDIEPDYSHWLKIAIFKIQDGDCRHLENRFFGHYALTDCSISAKFCMRKQNGMLTRATGQKMQMCKIQDGGRPPFWKSLNRYISIIVRFWWSFVHYIRYWTRLQSRHHLEIRFFGHNSSTDCPITSKFCMRKHNGMTTKATW